MVVCSETNDPVCSSTDHGRLRTRPWIAFPRAGSVTSSCCRTPSSTQDAPAVRLGHGTSTAPALIGGFSSGPNVSTYGTPSTSKERRPAPTVVITAVAPSYEIPNMRLQPTGPEEGFPMKVHHLNCGTMRPSLVAGGIVAHCLLIETDQGLVLVDTGFGTHEVTNPGGTINALSRAMLKPVLEIEETAIYQVEKRGYGAEDVRHILLTHLDLDHAGGLRDFPNATVHVLDTELEAATNPSTLKD